MKTALIRPGILVSLKTVVSGGISYRKADLALDELDVAQQEAGVGVKRWQTTRTIVDEAEHERASKTRSAAATAVRSQCARTSFGLLCPAGREEKLDEALTQARAMADEHNASAKHTFVQVYVLKGRIASTDEEAARAIASEVQSMLDEMNAGIDKLDPSAIRQAAARARQMSAMLADDQGAKVNAAIEAARTAAREIVKRVEKGGEMAAVVLSELDRGAIQSARMALLDFDTAPAAPDSAPLPAVNVQRFDFEEENDTVTESTTVSDDQTESLDEAVEFAAAAAG